MTMLALVYAAWNGAIAKAIEQKFHASDDEKRPEKLALLPTLIFRALPLTLVAWAAVIVFYPRARGFWNSVSGPISLDRIDDVGAAYVMTHILIVGIALSVSVDFVRLARHLLRD